MSSKKIHHWEIQKILNDSLVERERWIIGMRMQGYTLQQIADNFDRSRETIRQKEATAWARFAFALNKTIREKEREFNKEESMRA